MTDSAKLSISDEDDEQEQVNDWHKEAVGVIRDIKDHLHEIEIATELESSELEIFLNVTTLEMARYTVKLSAAGFVVVGNDYNFVNPYIEGDEQQRFELPQSLFAVLSPKFTESFGNSLVSALKKLKSDETETIE